MISIGNFFFKYRNLIFPLFALAIFIPSPPVFSAEVFGAHYYTIPMVVGLLIALFGQVTRAVTIALKYIVRGGKGKKVYADVLVVDGIFNHCRNPLYVGNISMLAGVAVMSNSLYFIVIAVPLFCFIYQAIVLAEENFLRSKFGAQFEAYCNRVNRWIPSFSGLGKTFSSMEFNWKRYVVKEYNTVYLLLVSIYIVLLMKHPRLVELSNESKIQVSAIVILTLTAVYLFIRYLKKSHKLVPSAS